MMNVEREDNVGEYVAVKGIGLYKIKYEMDVNNSSKDQNYIAGVLAYSSDEAVNTLLSFAKKNVKGFKGIRTHEVSFEGLCHSMSNDVRSAFIKTQILEGRVVSKEDYDSLLNEKKAEVIKTSKKSIIPKE